MSFFILQKNRGFTLVEILVVTTVVAVITSAVVVNVIDSRKKADDVQRMSDFDQFKLALRAYKDANSTNILPAYPEGDVIGDGLGFDSIITPYFGGTLRDPINDTTYKYTYDSNFNCQNAGGSGKKVLYASMERPASSNWSSVCGGTAPGPNTYVLLLDGASAPAAPVAGSCDTTVALGCTTGTLTVGSDNNQTSCGETRQWTCTGAGGVSGLCSRENGACSSAGVCANPWQFCSAGQMTDFEPNFRCNNLGATWYCSGTPPSGQCSYGGCDD